MITLYDITSKLDPQAWSPNTWKTRLLLNYKGVPYSTQWVSYPDIEPRMKALGAAPTGTKANGSPAYTLPVISDDARDPGVVADSANIADYLERSFPTPAVFPPGTRALQAGFIHLLATTLQPALRPLLVPAVAPILDTRGQEYFRRTRELQFGTVLEDVMPAGSEKRERQWAEVARVLDRIAAWLDDAESDGPWLGGKNPVYADFVLAVHFIWLIKVDVPDGWSRVQDWNDGRWRKLIENCGPYMKVE